MIPYAAQWVRFFGLTLGTELLVAAPLLAGPWPRRLLAVTVANFATHPFVWFVLAQAGLSRTVLTLVAEPWALAFETLVYALAYPAMPRSRVLAASAIANAASYGLGSVLAARLA